MTPFSYQTAGVKLHQLRYFAAVAEELHFRRAAERLHMRQPPLSTAIRDLERTLGVTLLERSRRHVALTPAGSAFLRDARALLGDLERAVDNARRVAAEQRGLLRIGFVGSAIYGSALQLVRAFAARRPDVELQLRERSTADQVAALTTGTLDIGFIRGPVEHPDLTTHTLRREETLVALPRDHPLADRRRVTLADVSGEPLVLFPRDQAPVLHDAIVAALADASRSPRIVQEVPEMQTIVGLVASGMGVSLVPSSLRALARDDVVYRELEGAPTSELALALRAPTRSALVSGFVASALAHPLQSGAS